MKTAERDRAKKMLALRLTLHLLYALCHCRWREVFSAVTLTVVASAVAPAAAHSVKYVEDQLREQERYVQLTNQEAPKFVLEDADGRKVSLGDFKGKVVVLNFVYARCKEECPLHSALIASIQQQVNQTPLRDQVLFVSIATDTEDPQETAATMRSYAGRYRLDPVNWMFLYRGSAPPDATLKLAEQYHLKFVPTGVGEQIHGVVTHVINQGGMLRARYHGLKFNPTKLIIHVGALLHGNHENDAREASADEPAIMNWLQIAIGVLGLGLMIFAAMSFYRMSRRRPT